MKKTIATNYRPVDLDKHPLVSDQALLNFAKDLCLELEKHPDYLTIHDGKTSYVVTDPQNNSLLPKGQRLQLTEGDIPPIDTKKARKFINELSPDGPLDKEVRNYLQLILIPDMKECLRAIQNVQEQPISTNSGLWVTDAATQWTSDKPTIKGDLAHNLLEEFKLPTAELKPGDLIQTNFGLVKYDIINQRPKLTNIALKNEMNQITDTETSTLWLLLLLLLSGLLFGHKLQQNKAPGNKEKSPNAQQNQKTDNEEKTSNVLNSVLTTSTGLFVGGPIGAVVATVLALLPSTTADTRNTRTKSCEETYKTYGDMKYTLSISGQTALKHNVPQEGNCVTYALHHFMQENPNPIIKKELHSLISQLESKEITANQYGTRLHNLVLTFENVSKYDSQEELLKALKKAPEGSLVAQSSGGSISHVGRVCRITTHQENRPDLPKGTRAVIHHVAGVAEYEGKFGRLSIDSLTKFCNDLQKLRVQNPATSFHIIPPQNEKRKEEL